MDVHAIVHHTVVSAVHHAGLQCRANTLVLYPGLLPYVRLILFLYLLFKAAIYNHVCNDYVVMLFTKFQAMFH